MVTLEPLRLVDIPEVGPVMRAIWREHFTPLIGESQVDYMLREKYTPTDLEPYLNAPGRWFELLRVEGELSGILRCALGGDYGLKLEEIYLVRHRRGQGLGQRLLERAEALARQHGCSAIFLYVNRGNDVAIAAYHRAGFAIRESQVFDIGQGFVMDDYRMEKSLS
jgi:diamine N-acetyltransferase